MRFWTGLGLGVAALACGACGRGVSVPRSAPALAESSGVPAPPKSARPAPIAWRLAFELCPPVDSRGADCHLYAVSWHGDTFEPSPFDAIAGAPELTEAVHAAVVASWEDPAALAAYEARKELRSRMPKPSAIPERTGADARKFLAHLEKALALRWWGLPAPESGDAVNHFPWARATEDDAAMQKALGDKDLFALVAAVNDRLDRSSRTPYLARLVSAEGFLSFLPDVAAPAGSFEKLPAAEAKRRRRAVNELLVASQIVGGETVLAGANEALGAETIDFAKRKLRALGSYIKNAFPSATSPFPVEELEKVARAELAHARRAFTLPFVYSDWLREKEPRSELESLIRPNGGEPEPPLE